MRKNIKLILADDHTIMRDGLVALLKSNPSIFVMGTASNGFELKELYFQRNPDIILTDIEMEPMDGLTAVKEIRKQVPNAKALFLSMHDDDETVYKVAKVGGWGLINKDTRIDEIIFALNSVLDEKEYFHGEWQGMNREKIIRIYERKLGNVPEPNQKEIKVIKLLCEGLTSQKIADEMKVSKKSVDLYRRQICQKFGLQNPTELIIFAKEWCDTNNT